MSRQDSDVNPPNFLRAVPAIFNPIDLHQMDPNEDRVYSKTVLHLTLIDDPLLGFTPIHVIAEDENGYVTRVFIHEVPQNKKMCDIFSFGQQIAIMNPRMRVALDGKSGIRVDDPATIVLLGKKKDMCRYCGKLNAQHKCEKCKRAKYCNLKCRVSDYKNFDHKVVCKSV